MPRRRLIIALPLIALLVPLLGLIGYAAYGPLRDFHDRNRLTHGCYADRLNHVGFACERAAAKHDGRLPDRAEIVAMLDDRSTPEVYTTCAGCDRPFEWNVSIAGLELRADGRTPLVWCPPGSHGRWVGVVMLDGGKVETQMLTVSELAEVQALKPTAAATRPLP